MISRWAKTNKVQSCGIHTWQAGISLHTINQPRPCFALHVLMFFLVQPQEEKKSVSLNQVKVEPEARKLFQSVNCSINGRKSQLTSTCDLWISAAEISKMFSSEEGISQISCPGRKVWRKWTHKKAFFFISHCVSGVWGHGVVKIVPITTGFASRGGQGHHGNWSHSPLRVPEVGCSPPWRKYINLCCSAPKWWHPTGTFCSYSIFSVR